MKRSNTRNYDTFYMPVTRVTLVRQKVFSVVSLTLVCGHEVERRSSKATKPRRAVCPICKADGTARKVRRL